MFTTFKDNKTLAIIGLIAIVNALGYGIIIPILYSYSQKFGLTDFQNGLLFALFSLCQFISAPLIGRMSDKYGRKPLLIISIAGTALSFFIAAFAPNAFFLFLARALDGLTAGNLPVASAVIADTTEMKDRAKGFGVIGASFGFGFIFGPAISAFTVGISPSLPFIIAGIISVIAVILTTILLPETNKHIGQVQQSKLFDIRGLVMALFAPNVGRLLGIGLIYALVFAMYIYAFQPYAVKILHFSPLQISIFFTAIGIIGLLAQVFLIGRLTKLLGARRLFSACLACMSIIFAVIYFFPQTLVFIVFGLLFALVNSFTNPLIQTLLSQETDEKSQGSIQGINASYMSLGMIFGPIIGGGLTTIAIRDPFLGTCILSVICFILSLWLVKPKDKIIHGFE